MKNKINYILILLSIMLGMGCDSKEDITYEGTDRNIVSFSLSVGNEIYKGVIFGTEIFLSLPAQIDLSRAVVNYQLSENATIVPNPTEIANWHEEQVFRVQAHNSDYVSYKVIPCYIANTIQENIQLTSQKEVDDFATRQINTIQGNLIIGSTAINTEDPILSLNALNNLTEVSQNIVINASFSGINLDGLQNLKRIGGLHIGSESVATSIQKRCEINLPNLEKATNIILYSDSLSGINLPKLQTIGNIYINSINLKTLNINSLRESTGNVILKAVTNDEYSEEKSNTSLQKIDLSALETVFGSLIIDNFWKIKHFSLPQLDYVGGNLNLQYLRKSESIRLPKLTRVMGNMKIYANDGVEIFEASQLRSTNVLEIASYNNYSINLKRINLQALERVDSDFTVLYFGGLSLDFPQLKFIEGGCKIDNMQFLERINLPLLKHCQKMTFSMNPMIECVNISNIENLSHLTINSCRNLAQLQAPKTIAGDVTLTGNNKSMIFPQITGMNHITGKLKINSFPIAEINLPDILTLGDMELTEMEKLETIRFPQLTMTKNLTLKNLYRLNTVVFPSLTTIDGTLLFQGGNYAGQASKSQTTHLNGFHAVRSVRKVDICYAGNLADFTGLQQVISQLEASSWSVKNCKYNPTYQEMVDGKYTNIN